MRTLNTVLVPGFGNPMTSRLSRFSRFGVPPLVTHSSRKRTHRESTFSSFLDFQDSQDCRDLLVGSKWVRAARAARTARRAGLHVATRRMRGATLRGSMYGCGQRGRRERRGVRGCTWRPVGCAGRPHGGLCARRRVGTPNHPILKIFTILKSLKSLTS